MAGNHKSKRITNQSGRQSVWITLFDMLTLMPWILMDANKRCRGLIHAFHAVVDPLLASRLSSEQELVQVKARLLPTAVKVAFLIQNYSRLIGGRVSTDLALIAGAFTIVYDDLLDSTSDETLSARMQALFDGNEFLPKSGLEIVFLELYRWLEQHIPPEVFSIVYQALKEVHHYQTKSRYQQRNIMSDEELENLTILKGSKGALVLFAMAHDRMSKSQEQTIHELGSYFQHIDDYQDRYEDNAHGLDTLATSGRINMMYIIHFTERIAVLLRLEYDQRNVRIFVTGLYYWIIMVLVGSALKVLGLRRHIPRQPKSGRRYLLPIQLLL